MDWNLEERKQTLRELGILSTSFFFHWPASRIYQLPPLSNIPITESLFVSKHYFCLVFFSLNILRNPFSPPMGPVSSVCFIYFFCFGTGTHLSIIKKTTFQKTLLHCYWPPITQGNILLERCTKVRHDNNRILTWNLIRQEITPKVLQCLWLDPRW